MQDGIWEDVECVAADPEGRANPLVMGYARQRQLCRIGEKVMELLGAPELGERPLVMRMRRHTRLMADREVMMVGEFLVAHRYELRAELEVRVTRSMEVVMPELRRQPATVREEMRMLPTERLFREAGIEVWRRAVRWFRRGNY